MAVYQWTEGETVTAVKLNSWSGEIEDIKDDCEDERTRCESAVSHNPIIQNGTWWVWNPNTSQYQDTEVEATGENGVSPTLSANKVGKTTTISYTDATHPTPTTLATILDGNDGQGSGDMTKSAYDSTNAVLNAGGIVPYVSANGGKIDTIKVNGTAQTITNKTVDLSVPTKTSDITNDSNYMSSSTYDSNNAVANAGGIASYVSGQIPKLTDFVVYYVDPTNGNDSNVGTEESPFKTIGRALSKIPKNLNGKSAQIHLASGTYAESMTIAGYYNGSMSISAQSIDSAFLSYSVTLSNNVAEITIYGVSANLFQISQCIGVTLNGCTTRTNITVRGSLAFLINVYFTSSSTINVALLSSVGSCVFASSCHITGYYEYGYSASYGSICISSLFSMPNTTNKYSIYAGAITENGNPVILLNDAYYQLRTGTSGESGYITIETE